MSNTVTEFEQSLCFELSETKFRALISKPFGLSDNVSAA